VYAQNTLTQLQAKKWRLNKCGGKTDEPYPHCGPYGCNGKFCNQSFVGGIVGQKIVHHMHNPIQPHWNPQFTKK